MRRGKTLGLSVEEVVDELITRCGASGDSSYEEKIRQDVSAFFGVSDSFSSAPQSPPKVEIDEALFKSITASPISIRELRRRSVSKLWPDDDAEFSDEILDALFPPAPEDPDDGPWICCGYSTTTGGFCTKRREKWRGGLRDHQYLVAQRMAKERGLTRLGVLSWHSLDNTGPWEHLVVEFDEISLEGQVTPVSLAEQAALILHIAEKFGGLLLVVFSGNKSLHGWFCVRGLPDDRREELVSYALGLGACSGPIRNRSQFVRLPGGLRRFPDGTSKRQRVLYFHDPWTRHP